MSEGKKPCGVCGRETPWGGDCAGHLNEAVIVQRPSITVTAWKAGAEGQRVEVSYDANQLALVKHEARWKLAFLCSGELTFVPAGDVKEIRFASIGADWCMSCDERLKSWPSDDFAYASVVNTDTHERRPYPVPNPATAASNQAPAASPQKENA